VRGYLLDTNHVSAYFDKLPSFEAKLASARPDWLFWISAVSLGEIEASYAITNRDREVIRGFRRFVWATFLTGPDGDSFVLPIDVNTRDWYAKVISRIWKVSPPAGGNTRTEAHLTHLGVDINDVWIVATAWKHNLILLTTDRMKAIREVVPELNVDDWT